MKALVVVSAVLIAVFVVGLSGQGSADPLIEGFRLAEVASVADAMEQLTTKLSKYKSNREFIDLISGAHVAD